MAKVWAVDPITLNCSAEVDSTECYMVFGVVLGNIK